MLILSPVYDLQSNSANVSECGIDRARAVNENMLPKTVILCVIAVIGLANTQQNKARYDNYRLYRVELKTEDQVKIFQQLEARSDSYSFIGHAREINKNLTILVAAHKIAELTDIIDDYKVGFEILVS